ncbi:MAG: peptidylprolyl isomerase [Polyangia bacterium]|jgi:FKBP-type peptidyl-prolyl cis-trans isomerase SlyD
MQIEDGAFVTIHYTLTDSNGRVVDSSQGHDGDDCANGEPLSYLHGSGMIVPGLEVALAGKVAGDRIKVTIGPEGAYGSRREELVEQLSRDEFPEGEVAIGMHFRAHTDKGARVLTVIAVDDKTVTVDGNHPLAGATLSFAVEVISVRAPSREDMHSIGHGEHDCTSCHGCGH